MSRLLYLILIALALVALSISSNAQWAQTFGWGGAGNGKRALAAMGALQTSCDSDNTKFMSIINTLIQLEAQRLRDCAGKKDQNREYMDV